MKKILVLLPVLPQLSDHRDIAKTLTFLTENNYFLEYLDPLSIDYTLPNRDFYLLWNAELRKKISDYDAFFGFSFGGVILQQCLSLFEGLKKPLILFSTPSFKNSALAHKLELVIELCRQRQLTKALQALYEWVFYPNPSPIGSMQIAETEIAEQRLIFGLQKVLDTDSTQVLQSSTVPHIHFMGEHSNLVNQDNVIQPCNGSLIQVPGAGMRMLQDNPDFCEKIILEQLKQERFC